MAAENTPAWQTPKTNWQPQEGYLLQPDYTRLCTNAAVLAGQLLRCRAAVAAAPLPPISAADFVTAETITQIENAITAVQGTACPWQAPQAQSYVPGGASWRAADVNRLESAQQAAHESLLREESALHSLPFLLRGSIWA